MKTIEKILAPFIGQITDNVSDGVYILDKDMRILFMNKKAKKIMGVLAEDKTMIGMVWSEFLQKSLGSYDAFSYAPMKTEADHISYEVKLSKPDGSYSYLTQENKQVLDDNGELKGVVAIMHDVHYVINDKDYQKPDVDNFCGIIGHSPKMRDLYDSIKQVAKTDATVLILGETGTGKELVADAVHELSVRKDHPLVKMNCNAFSENILESELFGHVKGSFTGAVNDRKGRFELADKGSIFLDEIGEIDKRIQVKLLRVLQQQEIEKVGSTYPVKINTRIIAATNRDLKDEIAEGNFREDLYYRLKVFPIIVPPLRDRLEDIDLLVDYFIEKFSKAHNKKVRVSSEVLALFKRYSWPGNIRELEHTMEYAFIKTRNNVITYSDIPEEIFQSKDRVVIRQEYHPAQTAEVKRTVLFEALKASDWNQTKTAKALGVSRTTVWRLIKKYNLKKPVLLTHEKRTNTNLIPHKQ